MAETYRRVKDIEQRRNYGGDMELEVLLDRYIKQKKHLVSKRHSSTMKGERYNLPGVIASLNDPGSAS